MPILSTQGFIFRLVDKLTGTILDQFRDESIKVSNNILELFDIGEIPGTYTRQITLPGTKKNNAYFEQYFDISVYQPDTFNTNQKVEAYLEFDSFYLLDGYIQLDKVNLYQNKFVDSYEITLFGVVSNFSADAKSFFLTDLSGLNRYNHTSSVENIIDSWDKNLFNGDIVYPLAEYGQKMSYTLGDFDGIDDFNGALQVQDFKPAIRVKRVWDEIFNSLGYIYTGSFWEQPFLEDIYMVCNRSQRTTIYNDIDIEYYGQGSVRALGDTGSLFNRVMTINSPFTILSDTIEKDPTNKFSYDFTGNTKYVVDFDTKLNCTIDLSYYVSKSAAAGNGQPQWSFKMYDSSNTAVSTTVLADLNEFLIAKWNSVSTTVSEKQNYTVNFITSNLPPDTYTPCLEYTAVGNPNFDIVYNPVGSASTRFEVTKVRQAADFRVMDIPSNLPFGNSGIKIIDFIRGLQKKYNLVIYADKKNPKSFIVDTFNEWYKKGQVKDFNRFVNINDKIEFIPANSLAYNKLQFKDKTDKDYATTIFDRENSRMFGESVYNDSGSYFSEGELAVETVFGNGPLLQIPGSGYTGSIGTVTTRCTSYRILNTNDAVDTPTVYIEDCETGNIEVYNPRFGKAITLCSRVHPYGIVGDFTITNVGDCTPSSANPTGSGWPIYVPYYISNENYEAATVNPRLFFYNGKIPAPKYWIEGYLPDSSSIPGVQLSSYPYFDHYSGSFPHSGSNSLLFNNETPVLGSQPTGSLISEYWSKYLSMLYNPRARLVNCTGVIPIGDYIDLELNDIAQFRDNYYHLRAINDYDLKTGECNIQLFGPIIPDVIQQILFPVTSSTPPVPTPTATPIAPTPTATAIPPTPTPTVLPPTPTPSAPPPTPTAALCSCYSFFNETNQVGTITYKICGGNVVTASLPVGQNARICIDTSYTPTGTTPSAGNITITPCSSVTTCTSDPDCSSCT